MSNTSSPTVSTPSTTTPNRPPRGAPRRERLSPSGERLFGASDVAALCQVDLKTIHNWVEKGTLEAFRTPGRHLRFKRSTLAAFCELYGYPQPPELAPPAVVPVPLDLASRVRDELLKSAPGSSGASLVVALDNLILAAKGAVS